MDFDIHNAPISNNSVSHADVLTHGNIQAPVSINTPYLAKEWQYLPLDVKNGFPLRLFTYTPTCQHCKSQMRETRFTVFTNHNNNKPGWPLLGLAALN